MRRANQEWHLSCRLFTRADIALALAFCYLFSCSYSLPMLMVFEIMYILQIYIFLSWIRRRWWKRRKRRRGSSKRMLSNVGGVSHRRRLLQPLYSISQWYRNFKENATKWAKCFVHIQCALFPFSLLFFGCFFLFFVVIIIVVVCLCPAFFHFIFHFFSILYIFHAVLLRLQ